MPDTWKKMDQVIAYWQAMGVDGFRCDMSHMVPPEFWTWLIARARQRHAGRLSSLAKPTITIRRKFREAIRSLSQLNGGQAAM